jgi:hypothetical protein
MTLLEEATVEIATLLGELHLQYMIIGAAAAGFWGEPRATLDVDVTIWAEPDRLEATVREFTSRFALRTANPMETVQRLRLLPVRATNGVPVDLLFAKWPLERQALDRAVWLHIGKVPVRVAPLDYLLFLKLISDRPKDATDAEVLIRRHRGKMDVRWLENELSTLAESLGQPEIIQKFQRLIRGDEG